MPRGIRDSDSDISDIFTEDAKLIDVNEEVNVPLVLVASTEIKLTNNSSAPDSIVYSQ